MNLHFVRTAKGRIGTYQIVGPSTWGASSRDAQGRPGPLEEALIGSPVIEEAANRSPKGIDIAGVVHSFDPCMMCGVH